MASRYVAYYDLEDELPLERQTLTVIEEEDRPVDTGLLDLHGTKIYRVPEKRRIGFQI